MKKINFVVITVIMFMALVPSVYAQDKDFRGVGLIPFGSNVKTAIETADRIGFSYVKKADEPGVYLFSAKSYLDHRCDMSLHFKNGKLVQGGIVFLINASQNADKSFVTLYGLMKEIYPGAQRVFNTDLGEKGWIFTYSDCSYMLLKVSDKKVMMVFIKE